MFGIGMPEMILILALALIVIGPKKLPDLAKSLGRALGEFKRATSDLKRSMEIEEISEVKSAFNELNQDINQTLKGASTADNSSSQAQPDSAQSDATDQPDTHKPLSDLKQAFDNFNQDAESTSDPSPPAATESDEVANQPAESASSEDTTVDDKGTETNERG